TGYGEGANKMKVGICGAGFIGKIHASAYSNIEDIKVAGFFDSNQAKAEKIADEFNISAYKSLKSMLSDDTVDIIDICVPTFLHREFVEKSLDAQKNVLCEKPIALNLEDAECIVEKASSAKTKFMIAHSHRFYNENIAVQEAAESGKLGKILTCSAYRLGVRPDWSENNWIIDGTRSGGAATDFILHDIDLCNWIGGKPETVMAQGVQSPSGAWDYMGISISYKSGVKGFVEGGWIFKGEWPFTQLHRIIGEKGSVQWISKMGKNIEGRNVADSSIAIFIEGSPAEYPELAKQDPFLLELSYFTDCVKNNKPVTRVKPEDAFTALQVSLAAKKSAEKSVPVRIS
ncbi:MAG: Gfo/Idh/MocA family oxidoreductase, partial [Actinobacteria bacterium]|nr:Gfo/Idh/MocA family oxidoreductase [Actinomycetota bacterium]